MADAATEFEALARALKDAGETGLRRELGKALRAAGQDLADEVKSYANLKPYMPDRYAAVLADDLTVQISQRLGSSPSVYLRARGRRKWRHVKRLNEGILTHPVFGRPEAEEAALAAGRGHGRGWTWVTQDIRPNWFDDPVAASGPQVRKQIEAALHRIIDRIYAA